MYERSEFMKDKSKSFKLIRKFIYLVLFSLVLGAFIYLSNKYESLSEEKTIDFTSYYESINTKRFEILNANGLLKQLKTGKHLIYIGNHTTIWSEAYAYLLTECLDELDVNASYYDLNSDKNQKNSKYYEIRERLKSSLITTDDSNNNLLAPSFYIVNNGKVEYYNITTAAVKNSTTVEDYWTNYNKEAFKKEIKSNIKRYYLNN